MVESVLVMLSPDLQLDKFYVSASFLSVKFITCH